MKERAMCFKEVALASRALELAPGGPTGMPIGTQVAGTQPAAIVTARMRTEVLRGVNGTGASLGRWQRIGSRSRGRLGRRCRLFTGGTLGFVGEASKRFGLSGALPAW